MVKHLKPKNTYAAEEKRFNHFRWKAVTSVLSICVAVGTLTALMLPAITMSVPECEITEHTHEDSCYQTVIKRTQICEVQGDNIVHTHDSLCYDENNELFCSLQENVEQHQHSDDCYVAEQTIVAEGHAHTDSCYEWIESSEPTCGIEESQGHTHGESCMDAESNLICGLEESAGHQHEDTCFGLVKGALICDKTECEPIIEYGEPVLSCGQTEGQVHQHTESCFADVETKELICELPEHTHTSECQPDLEADKECAADWEATLPQQHTGEYASDVLSIARSQLGYHESMDNYMLSDDETTRMGYTRYGEWYGDPYGDWCAMFVSFCIRYAGVDDFPVEAGCDKWIGELEAPSEQSMLEHSDDPENAQTYYIEATAEYQPKSGDLVFFDFDGDTHADHIGLLESYTPAAGATPAVLTTIQGNAADQVLRVTESTNDVSVLGYGCLPEQVFYCGRTGHIHDDYCGSCGIEAHIHTEACTVGLTTEERAQVDEVIALIDALPSQAEITEKMQAFMDSGDEEGQNAYYMELSVQINDVYGKYKALSDVQKEAVTNSDILMNYSAFFTESLDGELSDGDLEADFYIYNDATSEWKLIRSANVVFDGGSGQKDYILVDDLVAIFGSYGFTATPSNGGDVAQQIAYRTSKNDALNLSSTTMWYSNTKLSENSVPLDTNRTNYAIALLPGNKTTFSNVAINKLADYCNHKLTDVRYNSPNSGIKINLFNYGSEITQHQGGLDFAESSSESGAQRANSVDRDYGGASVYNALTLDRVLSYGGYPTGTSGGTTVNTAYLFSPDSNYDDYTYEEYIANRNSFYAGNSDTATAYERFHVSLSNDGGLFYKDAQGYYTYDSAVNAASFNGRGFTLYDHSVKPPYRVSGSDPKDLGNFLPFDDASNVYGNYTNRTYSDKTQLFGYNDTNVPNYSLGENVDLWFGMTMQVDFYMPADGKTDNGQDMVFQFSGDDDVWVYIDDVLVLDIGGIHGWESGSIDFATGAVNNPNLGNSLGGDELKLKDIFTAAGVDTSTFDGDTFGNYTHHTLKLFYMERGGNISYNRIRFNMVTMPDNYLTIEKELNLENTDMNDQQIAEAQATGEYQFRLVGTHKETGELVLFDTNRDLNLLGDDNYPLRDANGNYLTTHVDNEGWFTLKHGEKVMYMDIIYRCDNKEVSDFYVQERIPGDEQDLYYTAKVRYSRPDKDPITQDAVLEGGVYTSHHYVVNAGEDAGAHSIVYENHVNDDVLSKLRITKSLLNGSEEYADHEFGVLVTIGGRPAAGAEYNVIKNGSPTGDTREADAQGIVMIKPGETLESASTLLPGIDFKVQEVFSAEDTADGWKVSRYEGMYTDVHPDNNTSPTAEEMTISANSGVSGTLPMDAVADITIVNQAPGSATLSILKNIRGVDSGSNIRDRSFEVEVTLAGTGTANKTFMVDFITITGTNPTTETITATGSVTTDENGKVVSVTKGDTTSDTIVLGHREMIRINGLSDGITATVKELLTDEDAKNFTTKYAVTSTPSGAAGTTVEGGGTQVTISDGRNVQVAINNTWVPDEITTTLDLDVRKFLREYSDGSDAPWPEDLDFTFGIDYHIPDSTGATSGTWKQLGICTVKGSQTDSSSNAHGRYKTSGFVAVDESGNPTSEPVTFTFTEARVYGFQVYEIDPKVQNIVYDNGFYTFRVDVKMDADGKLYIDSVTRSLVEEAAEEPDPQDEAQGDCVLDLTNGTDISGRFDFMNLHGDELTLPVDVTINVYKLMQDTANSGKKAGQYNFNLYTDEACTKTLRTLLGEMPYLPNPEDAAQTLPYKAVEILKSQSTTTDAGEAWIDLRFHTTGEYIYYLREVIPSDAVETPAGSGNWVKDGVTYSNKVLKVYIHISREEGQRAVLEKFEVTDMADNTLANFNQNKDEINEDRHYYSYDIGNYSAGGEAEFINTYTPAPATVDIPATKILVNDTGVSQPMEAGMFKFKVTEVPDLTYVTDDEVAQADSGIVVINANLTNAASSGETAPVGILNTETGEVTTLSIKLTTVGTHYFVIEETTTSVPDQRITCDTKTHTLVVTVVDNNGTLTVGSQSWLNETGKTSADFRNVKHSDSVSYQITGEKALSNRTLQANMFTFSLEQTDANGVHLNGAADPLTTTNTADGTFSFPTMKFTQAETRYYVLTEVDNSEADPRYTFDGTDYLIEIKVTEDVNNGNKLELTATYTKLGEGEAQPEPVETLQFENGYNPGSLTMTLTGTKYLINEELTEGAYTFNLYETDSTYSVDGVTPLQKTNAAPEAGAMGGKFTFDTISYELEDLNTGEGDTNPNSETFYYVVTESIPDDAVGNGYLYDESVFQVRVTVTYNPSTGNLTMQGPAISKVGGDSGVNLQFVNSKIVPVSIAISGTKVLEGRPLVNGEFHFVLRETDTAGNPIENGTMLNATNDGADGGFTFNGILYDYSDIGSHYYIVTEDSSAKLPNILYDDTQYLIEVEVIDRGYGVLQAHITKVNGDDVSYDINGELQANPVVFTNTYEGPVLPETGGTGTFPYILSGWAVIAVASMLIYITERKKRKEAETM